MAGPGPLGVGWAFTLTMNADRLIPLLALLCSIAIAQSRPESATTRPTTIVALEDSLRALTKSEGTQRTSALEALSKALDAVLEADRGARDSASSCSSAESQPVASALVRQA